MITRTPFLLFLVVNLALVTPVHAQSLDPFDPFSSQYEDFGEPPDFEIDKNKSADQLFDEAMQAFEGSHLLNARTKLLRALTKNPEFYKAHLQLGLYYMVHVGHHRLALRYILQGIKVFEKEFGPSPYKTQNQQIEHSQLLYLLSQARLNLDDYEGALKVLDHYKDLGYFASWYPGTLAWILMKLGRIDEAITLARAGVNLQTDPGRTLNMLGILLSMSGDPTGALEVFRQAIDYELSAGEEGQPATPLNNSGEVYKEMFQDEKALATWHRAKSLPDGCEHVLPSLNLALLAIDHLDTTQASRSLQTFLTCFAKYPLRNGEEHNALLHLIYGRTALLKGNPEEAINELFEAMEHVQWFGKIGTSADDLHAGILTSLASAFKSLSFKLSATKATSLLNSISLTTERAIASTKGWWYQRAARQLLVEKLNNFEDLEIRNTDSLLEYPTLGSLLASFPLSVLRTTVARKLEEDSRPRAQLYYKAYLAEGLLAHHQEKEGSALLNKVLEILPPTEDQLLISHLLARSLQLEDSSSESYAQVATKLYRLNPSGFRVYGVRLPVVLSVSDTALGKRLLKSPFTVSTVAQLPFLMSRISSSGKETVSLTTPSGIFQGEGETLDEAINVVAESVFNRYEMSKSVKAQSK
jgi:Tfp pilus assembly protein PilF